MRKTIEQILRETSGDVICVAHAGINCAFLSTLLGTPLETSRALPQPYGCFSRIQVGDQGEMEVKELGVKPKPAPDKRECQEIWDHYHTSDQVRTHCAAVCREAERIAGKLLRAGQRMDLSVIRSAALLHDVVRERENHAEAGAGVLIREGYPGVAELIKDHHDLNCPDREKLSQGEWSRWLMAAVVYLADKRTQHDRTVSLNERFARSREKCEQAEDREAALEAHKRRYRQAEEVETVIEKLMIGGEES